MFEGPYTEREKELIKAQGEHITNIVESYEQRLAWRDERYFKEIESYQNKIFIWRSVSTALIGALLTLITFYIYIFS